MGSGHVSLFWGLAETLVTSTQGWETVGIAGAGSAAENLSCSTRGIPKVRASPFGQQTRPAARGPLCGLGQAHSLWAPPSSATKAQVTALCPLYFYPAKLRPLGLEPAWLDWGPSLFPHPTPYPNPSREEASSRSTLSFQEWDRGDRPGPAQLLWDP